MKNQSNEIKIIPAYLFFFGISCFNIIIFSYLMKVPPGSIIEEAVFSAAVGNYFAFKTRINVQENPKNDL